MSLGMVDILLWGRLIDLLWAVGEGATDVWWQGLGQVCVIKHFMSTTRRSKQTYQTCTLIQG